jgi:TPR repeat protein
VLFGGVLAVIIITGIIVRADGVPPGSEVGWLSELAGSGDAGAELQLGLAYREGLYGLKRDPQASLKWLLEAARHGDAYAADAVANAYAQGLGIAVDPGQAAYWWGRAARGGNVDAQEHLGEELLAEGRNRDALRWLRAAADQGDVRAREDLARLYREDILPESVLPDADTQRGENPLEVLGAELHSPGLKALYDLWDAVETDMPILQSTDELLERANRGDPLAEFQLGLRYRDGAWAVRRDPAKARVWLERAAAAGNRNAAQALKQLGNEGSAAGGK